MLTAREPICHHCLLKLMDRLAHQRSRSCSNLVRRLDMPKGIKSSVGVCSITGCSGQVVGWGWCGKHYQRWKAHGDPLHERTRSIVNGKKQCTKCLQTKAVAEFSPSHATKNWLYPWCKSCAAAAQGEMRRKHPERFAERDRKKRLRYFGITVDDYDKLLDQQKGRCCLCKKPAADCSTRLAVDHDHITGAVRGLLCGSCNRNLGQTERIGLNNIVTYLSRDASEVMPWR